MKKITLVIFMSLLSFLGYAQFPESFDTGIPATWNVMDNGVGTVQSWTTTSTLFLPTHSGTQHALMDRGNIGVGNTSEDWLVTPQVLVPTNGQLRFWTKMTLAGDFGTLYQLRVSTTSQSNQASFTQIKQWTEAELETAMATGGSSAYNEYGEIVQSLNAYAGQNVYIAFVKVHTQTGSTANPFFGDRWLIDDVNIAQQCTDPLTLNATNISANSAQLSWVSPGPATSWDIELVINPAAPLGTPSPGLAGVGTNPYTVTGLTPGTQYSFYVRSVCGTNNTSNWTGPFIFLTTPLGQTCTGPIVTTPLPYTHTSNTGLYGDPVDGSPGASCGITGNYLNGNDVFYSFTPTFTGVVDISMTPTGNNSGVFVYGSCADVGSICLAGVANTGGGIRTIPFFAVNAGTTYYIVISTNGTPQTIPYTLNIQQVACPPPNNLGASGISQNGATLTWGNPSGATAWQYVFQPAGGGLPPGAGTPVATTSAPVTGLTANTSYEFYVRVDCGGATYSAWAGPFVFRTLCNAFPIPFTEGFNSTSTSQACWTVLNVNADANSWNMDYATNPFEGNQSASIVSSSVANNDWLISPQITGLNGNQRLKFRYRVESVASPCTFEVRLSQAGPSPSDMTTVLVAPTAYSNATYIERIVNMVGVTGNVNIGWYVAPGANGSRIYIDQVIVEDIPVCPEPSLLTVVGTTDVTATLQWTNGLSETQWQIVVQAPGSGVPTGASTLIPAGTNPFTVTGLNPATQYEYYIRAYCSATQQSVWVGPVTFVTTCSTFNVPFQEGFNSTSTTQQCWTVVNGNADADAWNMDYATTPFEGNQAAMLLTDFNAGANNDWLISPTINLTGNQRLKFHYRVQSATEPNDFRVVLSTTGTNTANFTQTIIPLASYNNITYVQRVVNLVDGGGVPYSGPVNIAWHVPAAGLDGWRIYIDNVIIENIPTCPEPSGLAVVGTTANTATLQWVAGGAETQWDIVVQAPGAGVPTGASTIIPAGTNPFTVTGLNPQTNYEYYVRAHCSGTDQSVWIGPMLFTTACSVINVPFQEGFNSTSPTQQCWTVINGNADADAWNMDYATTPFEGNQVAAITTDFNGGANDDWLISPALNLSATPGAKRLKFHYKVQSNAEPNDFRVVLSTTGGAPINFTQTLIPLASYGNVTYVERIVNLLDAGGAPYTGVVNIAWHIPAGGLDGWRLYVDNVIIEDIPPCPEPSGLVVNSVTQNSATLSWTAGFNETQWEIVVQAPGSGVPTGASTIIPAGTNPFTVTGLNPSTQYEFYIRANCNASGVSAWIGPMTFSTTQIPAILNFSEDFESSGTSWTLNNATQTNKWAVGTATSNGGAQALYISNNNGAANAFTNTSTSVVHAYRDILIPAGTNLMDLSFDWKGVGESCCDYLRVWTVPASFTPVAGTQITAASGGQQLGGNFNQQATWRTQQYELTAGAYAGQIMRLVFEWRNDSSAGTNPPAAVDNILLRIPTCPEPFNLTTAGASGSPIITLSWTPGGTETQWQVVVQAQGAGVPTGPGVIVNNTPSYVFTATHGVFYEYWVQALCGSTDTSDWVGPYVFSVYAPPGCANVDVVGVGVDIIDNQVLLCPGVANQNVELSASYFGIGATTSYDVSSITYNPPFPFTGGTQMNITTDDIWSGVVNLPFNFCFFGQSYSTAKVGSNGVVGFGIPAATTACPWSFNTTIPNAGFPIKNAIYGVYQDTDPSEDPGPNTTINYQVLGNYPCRALVVNFNEINQFSCGTTVASQTSQIVIYEISNIIEVYVNRRVPCTSWQSGVGVIGIQNAGGTAAYTPPGRNTGAWTATNEAWRFSPNAPAPVSLQWIQDGVVIGTNPNVIVSVSDDTTVTAQATYTVCDGSNVVISSDIDIVVTEELPTLDPLEMNACSNDTNPVFDLTQNGDYVLSNSTAANYTITYYHTQAEAEAAVPGTEIPNPTAYVGTNGEIIYMNIKSNAGCVVIKSFELSFTTVVPEFILSPVSPINLCSGATTSVSIVPQNNTFVLAEAFYEWTLPNGATSANVSPTLTVPEDNLYGTYTVRVKNGCQAIQTFVVNEIARPTFIATPTPPSCDGTTQGSIAFNPPGAAGSYLYSVDGGTYQAVGSVTAAPGTYSIRVMDAVTGCVSLPQDVTVVSPPGAPVISTVNVTQPTCGTNAQIQVVPTLPYSNLIISEVTDANTGSLTYIEIYNGTGATVNLSNYKLKLYNNGSATASCDFFLTGTVANNAVHVVKVSADPNAGGVVPNQTVTTCSGVNIDDNIRLTTATGTEIDVWGRPDGVAFTPSGQPGYTYRRLASASPVPSTTWDDTDWIAIDPEDYTNVGTYTPATVNYTYSINGVDYQADPNFNPATPTVPTDYYVTIKDMTTNCISLQYHVVINPVVQPTADISYVGTPFCSGTGNAAVTFTGTSGGVYSATPAGLSIDPVTGLIDLNTSAANTYTISYTIAAVMPNCPAFVDTTEVTIISTTTPVTGFSYTTPVCSDGMNPTPTGVLGFTTGGTYSGTAGLAIDPSTGEIDLSNTTAGTYTVTYTVDATACSPLGVSTFDITITAFPNATIAYTGSPYCEDTGFATVTFTGVTGGVYSSTGGLVIDAVTGAVDLNSSTPGSYTVTYSIAASAGCPSNDVTAQIVISQTIVPVTGFSYPTPVCILVTNPTPSGDPGFTTGGVYSSTAGLAINAATGEINLAASTAGIYTVTYTVAANPSTCVVVMSSTFIITIDPSTQPMVDFSYPDAVVCSDASTQTPVLDPGFISGGTFSSTSGLSIDPVTGVINVATSTAGTYTVTYTLPANISICQSQGVHVATISILGEVMVDVDGGCEGGSYVVSATPIDGSFDPSTSSYLWTGPVGFVNPGTASFTATATGVYSVEVTTLDGCKNSATFEVDTVSCMIPNGISPNGDGKNDSFNLEGLKVRNLGIYNRYGSKVYSYGFGYTKEWHGQSDAGQELPDGTYYYVIDTVDGQTKTGWVYINRER
jgi:gliding motility-associated-like protein